MLVHIAVHFKHISKTIGLEVIIKMLTAFDINLNYNTYWLIFNCSQVA